MKQLVQFPVLFHGLDDFSHGVALTAPWQAAGGVTRTVAESTESDHRLLAGDDPWVRHVGVEFEVEDRFRPLQGQLLKAEEGLVLCVR